MNVKGLVQQPITNLRPVDKVDRAIRSDSAQDRDANGQQARDNPEEKRNPMSEEQLAMALEHLRQLPAVKEHHWTVDLIAEDGKKSVIVKDNLGTVIRRIPEMDLWSLPLDEQGGKGQLLKKSA